MVVDASPNGGTATVCITIKDHDGHVVKTPSLGSQRVNTLLTAEFTCSLPVGTYRFYVTATDRAGNTQSNIASNTLRVRKADSSHD